MDILWLQVSSKGALETTGTTLDVEAKDVSLDTERNYVEEGTTRN